MGELLLLVVIGSSIWVYFDAKSIGVRKGLEKGFFDMGPSGWAAASLLLWIFVFPAYLAKRGTLKGLASGSQQVTPVASPEAKKGRGKAIFAVALFAFALSFYYFQVPEEVRQELSFDKITLAKYTSLQNGITYANAMGILGDPGVEVSSNSIAGFNTVMYSWKNRNGSNMNAMFQNDALIQKAQFGLK